MPTIVEVVKKHTALKRKILAIEEAAKKEAEPFKSQKAKIEAWLQRQLLEQGINSIPTDAGTPYISEIENFSVVNRAEFEAWCLENNKVSFFTNAVSKDELRDFVKESGGELPPGLKYSCFKKLNVRASKE